MKNINKTTLFIALVWLINGLFCKVLNFVPRHEQIISRILRSDYSKFLTISIGLFEILMVVWILSKYKRKINAFAQITIVLIMNTIELIRASDLLLWGYLNFIFALVFIGIIYYNEFITNELKTI